jgi:hypothetical protein
MEACTIILPTGFGTSRVLLVCYFFLLICDKGIKLNPFLLLPPCLHGWGPYLCASFLPLLAGQTLLPVISVLSVLMSLLYLLFLCSCCLVTFDLLIF